MTSQRRAGWRAGKPPEERECGTDLQRLVQHAHVRRLGDADGRLRRLGLVVLVLPHLFLFVLGGRRV